MESTIIPLLQMRRLRCGARKPLPPGADSTADATTCNFRATASPHLIPPTAHLSTARNSGALPAVLRWRATRAEGSQNAGKEQRSTWRPGPLPLLGGRGSELQGPAGSCRGRRRRWDQRGVRRESEPSRLAGAQRSERSCGHWCGGPGSGRRQAGAPTLLQPRRAEELGLCPELGGDVRAGPRLSLAHCGDLAFPGRGRALHLGEPRSLRTFLRSGGAPRGARDQCGSRHAAAPGPPQGDGARSARSLRAAARCWRGGPRGLETPGGGREPSPRPASGAPASAPLFPPGLEAPSPERHRESSARRGAIAAPPGPERSPGAAGRSRGRGRPPARTSHGGLSRGGIAEPSEVRASAPPDPGRARRPERPPALEPAGCALSPPQPSRVRRLPPLVTRPPPPPAPSPAPGAPLLSPLPSLRSRRLLRPLPALVPLLLLPPNFSANSR